jgi:S1-C subfamily serine protease
VRVSSTPDRPAVDQLLEYCNSNLLSNLRIQAFVEDSVTFYAETPMLLTALLALALGSTPAIDSVARDTSTTSHTRAEASAPRRHTTFGVAIAPVPESIRALPYLEADEGVVLAQVQPRSAAEAAGLRSGDLVLSVDGKRVDETTIFAAIRRAPRNQAFRVEFLRDRGWHEVWVRIDQ